MYSISVRMFSVTSNPKIKANANSQTIKIISWLMYLAITVLGVCSSFSF